MAGQAFLPRRIEGVRSPIPADSRTLRLCDTERDAFLASVQLSHLTYEELAVRIGVTKQAVNKWKDRGIPGNRVTAFCNATGTLLMRQYLDLQRALRESEGREREADRIAHIASFTRAA